MNHIDILQSQMNEILQQITTIITDQDDFPRQETNVDAVHVDVHLIQEGHSPVSSTSDVLASDQQRWHVALQVVALSEDVGVGALVMMREPVECSVVRIPRDGALVKPWWGGHVRHGRCETT